MSKSIILKSWKSVFKIFCNIKNTQFAIDQRIEHISGVLDLQKKWKK